MRGREENEREESSSLGVLQREGGEKRKEKRYTQIILMLTLHSNTWRDLLPSEGTIQLKVIRPLVFI